MCRKPLFIFLLLIFTSNLASSQVVIALLFGDKLNSEKLEFGLNVGGSLSTLTKFESDAYQSGLNLGMNFVITLSNSFQLNPSFYFKYPLGAGKLPVYQLPDSNLNVLLEDAKLTRELNYFSLPLTIRYRMFGKTYVEVGPQFMLNNKAQDIFVVDYEGREELEYQNPVRDNLNKFDVGYTFGFSHKLPKDHAVTLTLRYYESFRDVDLTLSGVQKNRALYFSVGIPIGTASKDEIKE